MKAQIWITFCNSNLSSFWFDYHSFSSCQRLLLCCPVSSPKSLSSIKASHKSGDLDKSIPATVLRLPAISIHPKDNEENGEQMEVSQSD